MAESRPTSQFDPNDWKELLESTPAHLRDDPLILYFRCKFADRDRLLNCLTPAQREKITSELDRVDQLRSSFSQNVNNVTLVQVMPRARLTWRRIAKERSPEKIAELRKLLRVVVDLERKRKTRRNILNLESVSGWRITADPLRPNTSPEEDKGYGFVAHESVLTKDPESGSYGDYSPKQYPLHDVLYNKTASPLAQTCDDNKIRYFHFPANNMLWVEVCMLPFIHRRMR